MTSGEIARFDRDGPVELYVAYRGYLTVQQLQSVLAAMDDAYEIMFYAMSPHLAENTTHGSRSRLRIQQIETGNSVTVVFSPGVQQVVVDAVDPAVAAVGGGAMVLALASRFVLASFRRYSIIWHEHRSRQLEIRRMEVEVEYGEVVQDLLLQTLRPVAARTGNKAPVNRVRDLTRSLHRASEALHEANITRATLRGESLTEPEPEPVPEPGSRSSDPS